MALQALGFIRFLPRGFVNDIYGNNNNVLISLFHMYTQVIKYIKTIASKYNNKYI